MNLSAQSAVLSVCSPLPACSWGLLATPLFLKLIHILVSKYAMVFIYLFYRSTSLSQEASELEISIS